jgi:hypothetical protein
MKIIRSSCPILNLLANSKYIDYKGKNLTSFQIVNSCNKLFGLNKIILLSIILITKILCRINLFDNFSLKDISKHNCLEHDASLFFDDYYFTGNKKYCKVNENYVYDLIKLSKDNKNITMEELKIHKKNRIEHSKKYNPKFVYGIKAKIASRVEMYLLTSIIGKNNSISIDKLKKYIIEQNL